MTRFKFYFGAIGPFEEIASLGKRLDLAGATLRAVPRNRTEWQWWTDYQVCVTNSPGDELEEFLKRNWRTFRD